MEALVCSQYEASKALDSSAIGPLPCERICTHVEQVVSGHTRLSRDTSWDDDDLGSVQGLFETVVVRAVASGL